MSDVQFKVSESKSDLKAGHLFLLLFLSLAVFEENLRGIAIGLASSSPA